MEQARRRRQLSPPDFDRMNLPKEYWRANLGEVSPSVQGVIENYLRRIHEMFDTGAGLMLAGSPGVGKTAIAAMILKEARCWGYTAYFTPVWELRESIRSYSLFDAEQTVAARCREVDILALDGLSIEDFTEKFLGAKQLEELLTSRSMRRQVTILTLKDDRMALMKERPSFFSAIEGSVVGLQVTGPNLREVRANAIRSKVIGPPISK